MKAKKFMLTLILCFGLMISSLGPFFVDRAHWSTKC